MTGGVAARPGRTGSPPAHRPDLKAKLLTVFVVSTNVFGNFSLSWGMKHQAAKLADSPLALYSDHLQPLGVAGNDSVDSVAALAHDAARVGRI